MNRNSILNPADESDFIFNEGRKTGKFYFLNEENEKVKESNSKSDNNYDNKEEILKVYYNRNYLAYFAFLVKLYMRNKVFNYFIQKISSYTKLLDKKYATKMFYNIIKRRIIFYKIKFYRRLRKIRKFYIKYEQKLNLINNRKNIIIKK